MITNTAPNSYSNNAVCEFGLGVVLAEPYIGDDTKVEFFPALNRRDRPRLQAAHNINGPTPGNSEFGFGSFGYCADLFVRAPGYTPIIRHNKRSCRLVTNPRLLHHH